MRKKASRRPIWLAVSAFALAAAVALALEGLFRHRGVRPPPPLPAEQLLAFREASGPFFRVRWRGFRRWLVQVPQHYAYVPPQTFPLVKDPGVRRILVVGESSAVALGRAVRQALEGTARPDAFEVMNLGSPGGTLEEVELRIREGLGYSPDLIVFLFGHNLFYRSPTPRAWSFRAVSWARRSWFFSWLTDRVGSPIERRFLDEERWRALEAVLRRLASAARERRIPWVACTVPGNLWFPPTAAKEDLTDPGYLEARFLALTGRPREAVAHLQRRLQGRDRALWHFEAAVWLDRLGDAEGARRHLLASRDRDTDRSQASGAVNDLIRRVAREEGGWLLDGEEMVRAQAPDGIPGWECFDDEQHVSGALLRVQAAALLDLARGNGWPAPPTEAPAVEAAPQPFPFTFFLQYLVHNMRDYRSSWARAVAFKVESDVRRGGGELRRRLEDWIKDAASPALPENWTGIVLLRAAEGFWRAGDRDEAWRLNGRVARAFPAWEEPLVQRGEFLLQEARRAEALSAFRRAAKLNNERRDVAFFLRVGRSHAKAP